MRRLLLIALAGTAAFAAAPTTAGAGTASRESYCAPGCSEWPVPYTYRAAPGERNDARVRLEGGDVVFTDAPGVPLVAGEGCRVALLELRCAIDHSRRIYVLTDDLDDRVTVDPAVDDAFMTHAMAGDGPDEVWPGGSTWTEGGLGDDVFHDGPAGRCCVDDDIRYTHHPAGVTVRLATDGASTGNGAAGESDTIDDGIESVHGTWYDDLIVGDDDVNDLYGSGGADRLEGHGSNDWLWAGFGVSEADGGHGDDKIWPLSDPVDVRGGDGRDTVRFDNYFPAAPVFVTLDDVANDGSDYDGDLLPDTLGNVHADVEDLRGTETGDRLFGSGAANRIEGDPGGDWIVGLAGEDALLAGDGDDVVIALDLEEDLVDCGADHDVAVVDPADDVSDCELVLGSVDDLPPLFEPHRLVAQGRGAVWLREQVNTGRPDWFSYHAPAGVDSEVTVSAGRLGDRLTVRIADASAAVVPGPGCEADGDGAVCQADAAQLGLALGDGDDRVVVTGDAPVRVDCGPGADDATLPPGTDAVGCEDGAPAVDDSPEGAEGTPAPAPTRPPGDRITWDAAGVTTYGPGEPVGRPAALGPPAGGESSGSVPPAAGGVRAGSRAILVGRRRVVVGIRCDRERGTCRGTLRLVARGRTLARARYAVPAGRELPVALRA
ncbi:MAG TPA: hypothetical protein VHF89_21545, partial [Solirubrobacteraceae bacterium]|nr:hypothetical protein [Solirubrobacteraceae bacterium]